ncbi:hypothetical protein Tco_1206634 [Tanacetum coccineum]
MCVAQVAQPQVNQDSTIAWVEQITPFRQSGTGDPMTLEHVASCIIKKDAYYSIGFEGRIVECKPNPTSNTLAEYMILSGADNHQPMLDKDLYDSWKSRMELYMQNKENERMIFESVEHSLLIWPTIEENRVTRTKKYVELSTTEKIQPDCDLKETNIILQGLPSDIYSLVNHHRVAKDLWEKV